MLKSHASDRHLVNSDDAPHFRLLSDEKVQRIHEASLSVLEEVGVRILTEEARRLLEEAGCAVVDDEVVKIPRGLVEEALESAPKVITLYDREGEARIRLDGRQTYFSIGITALIFHDVGTGERRQARVEDIATACRLADALPNIDFVCTPMVTKATPEIPQHLVNQHEFEAMVSNTTKPLVILVDSASDLEAVLAMAGAVVGGGEALRNRPFVVPFLSTVSPLLYNAETLDKLLLSVDRGIPVRCGSGPMAGGTGPITAAGTSTLCISEIMAGLVISQIRRPGAPFIWGNSPAILDMKTANIGYTTPDSIVMRAAVAELVHNYGLPISMSGCVSSSMHVDQQAALEQMMGAYGCVLYGADMVNDVGALESALIFSPEAAVLGDEIIGMVRRIMRGIPVDDESLALDTIRSVGPGGNFLETEHTFRHYKKEQWQPSLLCRTTYDSWAEGGGKLMGQRAREKLDEILRTHQPRPLAAGVKEELSRIMRQRREAQI